MQKSFMAAVLMTAAEVYAVSCEGLALSSVHSGTGLGDDDTQPVCGKPIDGTRTIDRTPVPDNCCRIYELENMSGTYLEICNDGDGQRSPVAWLDSMRGSYDNER